MECHGNVMEFLSEIFVGTLIVTTKQIGVGPGTAT